MLVKQPLRRSTDRGIPDSHTPYRIEQNYGKNDITGITRNGWKLYQEEGLLFEGFLTLPLKKGGTQPLRCNIIPFPLICCLHYALFTIHLMLYT